MTEELLTVRINLYLTPLLVSLGVVLNLLTVVVFCRPRMRKYIFSVSMIALAICDSLVLAVPVLLTWIDENFFDWHYMNNSIWCNLHGYTDLILCANSSWIMILISLERWFAVCRPLEKTSRFTANRLRFAIVSQFLASAALFAYFPLSLHVTKSTPMLNYSTMMIVDNDSAKISSLRDHECEIIHDRIYSLMGTVSVLMVYVIPFFLLAGLNTHLIIGLRKRHFQSVSKSSSNLKLVALATNPEDPGLQNVVKTSVSNSRNLSMTLVVVSCCNLILTIPFQLFWFYENFLVSTEFRTPVERNLKNVTFIIKNTNYLINFVLYSALSKLFREELTALAVDDEFYVLGCAFTAVRVLIRCFRFVFLNRKNEAEEVHDSNNDQ
jgi:hypothetical protein